MPTLLRKYGYRFHFYTAEPDEPPHVHVDGKGSKSKFWLADCSLVWQTGLNNREISKILDVVKEYKHEFMEAWNEYHG